MEKLDLAGTFKLNEARFTNVNVQEKINALSQRGKGDEAGWERSQRGLPPLRKFHTPGRDADVFGSLVWSAGRDCSYCGHVRREEGDPRFRGHLLLDTTLAETTSGWKAVLGRIAQPLFRRPGGAPSRRFGFRVDGKKPKFGLDVGRALGPG